MTEIRIPELSLVVLIGPSGAGKSTFARKHFLPTEILSSDVCRGLVADDENDQTATGDAFEVLHFVARKRLERGNLTVVDATNVQREARQPLVAIAREYHCIPVAIVLNLPAKTCEARNKDRPERDFGPHVVNRQVRELRRSIGGLRREGFGHVFVLSSSEEIEAAIVRREPLYSNRKTDHGPFDIIGDVHGCYDELEELLALLGYVAAEAVPEESIWAGPVYRHREGRRAIFLGDLVDRGSRILETVRLVHNMAEAGSALCLPGNHDMKLMRKLRGRDVHITHGLADSLREIDALPEDRREETAQGVADFIDSLVSHFVLDGGKLVVAHAGMKESMQGRGSRAIREFALYGETTGETDEYGLPVRQNWAADYRGKAMVVYGHTPVAEPEWLNRTINIDTGCVFGGSLTALRYPERELVSVPAHATYYELARPFLPDEEKPLTAQQQHDELLDIEDVLGKRLISTSLMRSVTIREEQAAPALEVMSRFAVDPRWLIYLPPTMAPTETSQQPGLLEHPAEAFAYFRSQGAPLVVCEQKHMGSRAVVVICRDENAARARFGVTQGEIGVCYTRTGRRFFADDGMEGAFLTRIRDAATEAEMWKRLETDWLCLDCELMPWSAKAQDLLKNQYAAVGTAAHLALNEATRLLRESSVRGVPEKRDLSQFEERVGMAERYVEAYRRYCWPVHTLADLKLAPFHLLATEGRVHTDKPHTWHMEILHELARQDSELLLATACRTVDVTDPESEAAAVEWWDRLTEAGGEGMVAKPLDFIARGKRGLIQPAVKCRGREYLRLIYGPEYTAPENLERLRSRRLSLKRSLALRQLALGIEALERFVRLEPLRRVHECVFGILALESEPVDPRL